MTPHPVSGRARQGGGGSRLPIAVVGLLLLAGVGAVLYAGLHGSGQSDEEQVLNAMTDISAGMRAHSVSQVSSHMTEDFHCAGMNRQQCKAGLLQLFHTYPNIDVVFTNPQLAVHGTTADLRVDVEVNVSGSGTGQASNFYHSPVQVQLVKEPARRMLFFPTSEWKVANANAPNMPDAGGY